MRGEKCIELDGLQYTVCTPKEAAAFLIKRASFGSFTAVFTPGVTVAAAAAGHAAEKSLLQKADMLLPDGAGTVLAARLAGAKIPSRCPGIEVAEELLPLAAAKSLRLFLYGGKEGVAWRAAENIRRQYPGLTLAFCDGYGEDPTPGIRAFRPDILFVCLGFPKQEAFILAHKADIPCLCLGLGGSLDVFSGDVPRAPAFFRKTGLEWAFRLAREPGRLARLAPVPGFLLTCFGKRMKSILHNLQKKRKERQLHRNL